MQCDLEARRFYSESVRVLLKQYPEDPELADLHALLEQWQCGTLHGRAVVIPPPDPSRFSASNINPNP